MHKHTVIVTLAALTAFAVGCGKSEKTYNTSEGQVKVKEQKGEITYEATTKDGKVKIATGEKGIAMPDGFPKDVPVLKGATVKMSATQGSQMHVAFHSDGTVSDAAKFYETELKAKGWEIAATMNMGEVSVVSAKKDKRECSVAASKDSDGGSMVQVTVSKEG